MASRVFMAIDLTDSLLLQLYSILGGCDIAWLTVFDFL